MASNPEFLAQGSAVHDTLHAARIVIGTESRHAEEMLQKIYEPFQLPVVSVDFTTTRQSLSTFSAICLETVAM